MGLGRLHPDFQPYAEALVEVATYYNLHPQVTSTYRSITRQAALYEARQRGEHPLPVARPGCSYHNYGLAFDLVADDLPWLGKVWQSWGGVWGGASDPVHFQVPGGRLCG